MSVVINGTTGITDADGGTVLSTADIASQVQAEAGTDNATVMTPLRTAQAIQATKVILGPFATTSGTSITITGIPANVAAIDLWYRGVVCSTNTMVFQIGPSAGVVTTGYTSGVTAYFGNATAQDNNTNGFSVRPWTAGTAVYGLGRIQGFSGGTWMCSASGTAGAAGANGGHNSTGTVTFSGDLVNMTISGGTFSGGSVYLVCEIGA
jgi:hypothetical protein